MQDLIQVEANVQWACFRAAGGNWVGSCDPLKLTVQSSTYAELMEDIGLTMNAILKDLLLSNELEQFLRDRGWQLLSRIPTHPKNVRFDVPFIPAIVNRNGIERELSQ